MFFTFVYYAFCLIDHCFDKCFKAARRNVSYGELLKFVLNILVYLLGWSDRADRALHGDRGLHLPVFGGRQSDGGGRGGLPG
jgi:hypothetical protein